MAASREFLLQWHGYGLTTAEIHYHLPDHPALVAGTAIQRLARRAAGASGSNAFDDGQAP